MKLYKVHLVDILFTGSTWTVFRNPGFDFRIKNVY